jgi:predicted Zn-dependent protease
MTIPAGRAERAATLAEAARGASRRGAPETACTYLERALAEDPDSEAEPRLALELAGALGTAGRWDEATQALSRGLRSDHAGPVREELTTSWR